MNDYRIPWDYGYTPHRGPRVGRLDVDIIIDEDGQTWVKEKNAPSTLWVPTKYIRIEELRAEDYHPTGSTGRNSRKGPGVRGGRASNGYAGSSSSDYESGDYLRDDYTKLTDSTHAMVMDWMREHIKLEEIYSPKEM